MPTTESRLTNLQETLIGTWDSPIMTLEFTGTGVLSAGKGTVTSTSGRSIGFDYQIVSDAQSLMLSLSTPMTGVMEYEIADWAPDRLTLIKKGFSGATDFVKRS